MIEPIFGKGVNFMMRNMMMYNRFMKKCVRFAPDPVAR